MEHNRRVHDKKNREVVKDEPEVPTKEKHKPFIHQLFGHDQQAVEGYKDCDKRLRQALAQEMAERSASTEVAGAIKTVPSAKTQEGDDLVELDEEENLEPDSQKIDDEAGDLFD